jgi:putative oxidoreductase
MKLEHPIVPLVGRLLITYIFATSGIAKAFFWSSNVEYMSTRHLPMIPGLLAIAMIIELAGSVCLVTGYQARFAAFVMFWYTTAVTVLFHNYWAAGETMAGMQETHFRKNLAIMGGLLVLAYAGPGKWALGEHAARRNLLDATRDQASAQDSMTDLGTH